MGDHDKLRGALEAIKSLGAHHAQDWVSVPHDALNIVIEAARSTLPKTAMVNVWHVEYCYFDPHLHITSHIYTSEREAGHRAARMREEPKKYLCVHVTGPHQQEVPA